MSEAFLVDLQLKDSCRLPANKYIASYIAFYCRLKKQLYKHKLLSNTDKEYFLRKDRTGYEFYREEWNDSEE